VRGRCYGCGDDNPIGLGLRFVAEAPGVTASFVPRPEHQGPPGHLHGGVAATCLDETMAALGYVLDGVHCITATLELRYRRPVPLVSGPLRIEAWRDERVVGRRRQRVHGHLLLPDGTIAVQASGIFVQVRPR
jgi:acyl-coenzyme A thioesterase PaaI-like protein